MNKQQKNRRLSHRLLNSRRQDTINDEYYTIHLLENFSMEKKVITIQKQEYM